MESELYVKLKKKACDSMGIEYEGYHMSQSVTQEEVMECVKQMQKSKKVSGILVQLPLPEHICEQEVLDLIGPEKDVDGLHPLNIGRKLFLLISFRFGLEEALTSILLMHPARVPQTYTISLRGNRREESHNLWKVKHSWDAFGSPHEQDECHCFYLSFENSEHRGLCQTGRHFHLCCRMSQLFQRGMA